MKFFIVFLVLVIAVTIGCIIYLKQLQKKEKFTNSSSKKEEVNKLINYVNYLIQKSDVNISDGKLLDSL